MRNGFIFGDHATWDFDMRVQSYPEQKIPARRQSKYTVLGRNGVLHEAEDAWDNFSKSYDCYFHGRLPMPEQAHAVKAWLAAEVGVKKLRDAYDPEHYYLATYAGPADIENRLNRYGIVKVEFDCNPQAFLVSGDIAVEFTHAEVLHNPTAYTARPLVTVYGAGEGIVEINGIAVALKNMDEPVILDCESMNAYSLVNGSPGTNQNKNISAKPFPYLSPGSNGVVFSGGVTQIEIIPRWWEL